MRNRQKAFINFYLQNWNATDAALKAGYSAKTARSIGAENLTKPAIAEEVKRRISEAAMSADEVLQRLAEQARGDLGSFFRSSERWTQSPFPTEEILEEKSEIDDVLGTPVRLFRVRSVVLDLETLKDATKSGLVKKFTDSPKSGLSIELHDPQAALQLLGKHHRLFVDSIEHTGKDGGDIIVRQYVGVDPDEV